MDEIMPRVLYYQDELLNNPEFILVDGQFVDATNRISVGRQIFDVAGSFLSNSEPWVCNTRRYHFVKGLLSQEDELGRQMTFLYILPDDIPRVELLGYLTADLSLGGKTLDLSTEQAIQDYVLGYSMYIAKLKTILVLAVVVVLICILIWVARRGE